MIWEFTAYNGTVWKVPYQMDLVEALELFYVSTSLTDYDIKTIVNLH
jgi:hypothetical protein